MSEAQSIHSMEDFKDEEDFDGYKAYRRQFPPDKLMSFGFDFDPVKLAIDTLFRKCYENEQSTVGLRKENDKINYTLDEYRERLYQADEKFIIVQAKIGSVQPEDYGFAEIYKMIHDYAQKLSELEKELKDLDNSQHDEQTIDYYKSEMKGKLTKLELKLKEIEDSIKVFAELDKFRRDQEYVPPSIQRRDTLNKKNKAKLVEVDPLYSGTAKNFEEEKTTLDAKYRDCRQRFLSIQSNLYYTKPDAFSEERDNIYKKIEEAVNFAKTNRKRIEDLDTRTKKSIETTSETLQKDYNEEIQKCKTEILEIIKNAKLGGSSVDDATIQSIRGDIKDLSQKYSQCNDRLNKLEKTVSEHDELQNRLAQTVEGKVNKKDFSDLSKEVERIDQTLKQLLDQVNGIKLPAPVQMSDNSGKVQELERMLVALEEKLERTREALGKRMNDINNFMDMIKDDVDKTLAEQEKHLMKAISKTNICEIRIDALEKALKNSDQGHAPTMVDLDFKEALRSIKDLEIKVNEIRDDLMSKIAAIEYKRLPEKADKADFDELEKGLKDKVNELERQLMKLRMEFQNLSKMHLKVSKELKKEKEKEANPDKDEVSLIKKPLMGFKCANCERDLTNLEQTNTDFYNWRKLPQNLSKRKKINMNLHNIGQGFSKMLQTVSTDNLMPKDLLKTTLMEEDYENPLEETQQLPSIKREVMSDTETDHKRFKSPVPRKDKLK